MYVIYIPFYPQFEINKSKEGGGGGEKRVEIKPTDHQNQSTHIDSTHKFVTDLLRQSIQTQHHRYHPRSTKPTCKIMFVIFLFFLFFLGSIIFFGILLSSMYMYLGSVYKFNRFLEVFSAKKGQLVCTEMGAALLFFINEEILL